MSYIREKVIVPIFWEIETDFLADLVDMPSWKKVAEINHQMDLFDLPRHKRHAELMFQNRSMFWRGAQKSRLLKRLTQATLPHRTTVQQPGMERKEEAKQM